MDDLKWDRVLDPTFDPDLDPAQVKYIHRYGAWSVQFGFPSGWYIYGPVGLGGHQSGYFKCRSLARAKAAVESLAAEVK